MERTIPGGNADGEEIRAEGVWSLGERKRDPLRMSHGLVSGSTEHTICGLSVSL